MKRMIFISISILLIWGCVPPLQDLLPLPEITTEHVLLNLSTNFIEAPYPSGRYMFNITSNAEWAISSDQNWCTIQPASGSGDLVITVYVDDNTTPSFRTATLTVTAGNQSKQIKLEQGSIVSVFSNNTTAAISFGGGNGSQPSPYLIANAQQLKKLADDVNNYGDRFPNTYFKLMTDIHVTADEWIPIGCNNYDNGAHFNGAFDGNNHTITGTLQSNNYRYFGFFGHTYNCMITNLTIDANVINGGNFTSSYSTLTGAIAGYGDNLTIIRNCHVIASVKGGNSNSSYTGGIVGASFRATIQYCDVSGNIAGGKGVDDIDGQASTGGIVGSVYGYDRGSINNCTVLSSTKITGGESYHAYTGGIAGNNLNSGTIDDCTNNATVVAGVRVNNGIEYVGGLVGLNNNYVAIHTSLNTGNISGNTDNTGGLAGWNNDRIYSCCTNLGTVNNQAANENNQIGGGKEIEACPYGHTKR